MDARCRTIAPRWVEIVHAMAGCPAGGVAACVLLSLENDDPALRACCLPRVCVLAADIAVVALTMGWFLMALTS